MESRKTILICDDEPALRELIRASMDEGYEFAEASNGVTAARTATKQEARSKNLSVAALRLEKLVLDVENGVRGYALTSDARFLAPYNDAETALPDQRKLFRSLASDQPLQARRARTLDESIGLYIETFADPVVQFSNRQAALLAYDSEGRRQAASLDRKSTRLHSSHT